jgi:hypothetical protein
MGISRDETGATKKAIVIEVSRAVLGLMGLGLVTALTIIWNIPTDSAKRDGELAIIRERQDRNSEAVKELPLLKQDLGIVKYRIDELKDGQAGLRKDMTELNNTQVNISEKIDDVLRNQRTIGGTR